MPLKPCDLMTERRTIQSCLSILFSSASATRHQPWDSYIFPPEIVELIFLDVKACGGDVKAAASLNAKSDLIKKHSHFINLRFFRTENVLSVLPSTPRIFDADDVSFIDLEIKGVSSLTINVYAIEYVFCSEAAQPFFILKFISSTADLPSFAKPELTPEISPSVHHFRLVVLVQCYKFIPTIHIVDQVEGLLPLWTERILFDHLPHVFHRETVRCQIRISSVHFARLIFVHRFPQMKGRGVWLVDMIGSELIRSCVSIFCFLLIFKLTSGSAE
jgi:hypothetical protein